ncbi:MAG TPA: aminoglycoside phosphotransferase family protein [Planctomycetota bacterium]|jgi:Ser/Thr protein kinase RdoA (MazF antagonist)|nr:aminoglycoside phosphotransferase family protein [Planctomycetota bacterium]
MSPSPPLDPLQDESDDDLEPEDGGEVSGVLARRLDQLRDERWFGPVLESALAQMTAAGPKVAGYEIDYCKIKPNRDINVALRARLAGPTGAALAPLRLSCTLFASPEACRLKYGEDEANALHEATRRRLEAAGFARPVAVLGDPPIIVRLFPVDPALPGLAAATDGEEMKSLFASRLEACRRTGGAPRGFTHEILHYKPRRSCTIHYTVDLGDGSEPAACRVYGKLSRDDRGVRYHRLLTSAWEAALASGGLWRAARPVGYVPRWRLLLQEAVPGRDFRLVFAELTPDDVTPAQLERIGGLLDGIARAIRGVQRAPIPDGPVMTFERLFAAQERNLRYMGGLQPRLAAELAAIRKEVERLARETAPAPLVFSHGDFAHGNVLIEGDRVGIIDFDKAGAAEPVYDVAYFLTHMRSFGIRHPRRMPHVTRLGERFRDCYLALAPEASAERLSLYEALDFSAYVLRNFRKQSHQASWLAWAEGQVAAAWERLGAAAGRKGARPS